MSWKKRQAQRVISQGPQVASGSWNPLDSLSGAPGTALMMKENFRLRAASRFRLVHLWELEN